MVKLIPWFQQRDEMAGRWQIPWINASTLNVFGLSHPMFWPGPVFHVHVFRRVVFFFLIVHSFLNFVESCGRLQSENSGGTGSCKRFTAEFSTSAPMMYTSPPPMGPVVYTPLVLGRGSKCSWQLLPHVVLWWKIGKSECKLINGGVSLRVSEKIEQTSFLENRAWGPIKPFFGGWSGRILAPKVPLLPQMALLGQAPVC